MKKKKLKAENIKLKAAVSESRSLLVKTVLMMALGPNSRSKSAAVSIGDNEIEMAIPKEPQPGEPDIVAVLRKMAQRAPATK